VANRSVADSQQIDSNVVIPAAFTTDSTTVTGATVDTRGASTVALFGLLGPSSAGTTLFKIQGSDDNSSWSDITSATTGAVSTASRTHSVVVRNWPLNGKRYARLSIVNAGFTGIRGGFLLLNTSKGAGLTPTNEATVVVQVVV
jgi:hypothetical protein